MGDDELQPIIIKKINKGHGGHHGGAWKVAFADFMTAMMAFFLVMWLVGQEPDVRESVAGFFRDPGKFKTMGGAGVLRGSANVIPSITPTNGMLTHAPEMSGGGPSEIEKNEMTKAAQRILNELRKQETYDKFKDNIRFQLSTEGLRIILNESEDSPAFFEPGSDKLLQKSAIILITIAKELGTLPNQLIIEGHTDASFGGSRDYSNWELSYARAMNVIKFAINYSKLDPERFSAVGYGEYRPVFPNDSEENRKKNRRIEVFLEYDVVADPLF